MCGDLSMPSPVWLVFFQVLRHGKAEEGEAS